MKKSRCRMKDERGVSETIGFIILFGIMTTGIALVTLYGYPLLLSEQQNANIRNMERNMIVIQSDLKSLTFKNVPYRETTLQVAGGVLSIQKEPDPAWPNFTVIKDGAILDNLIIYPGELRFLSENGEAAVVLENGAVHIRYWGAAEGSSMLAEPRWFYDDPTSSFVITFLTLNATQSYGQTGIGLISMRTTDSTEKTYDVSGSDVRVKYQADPEFNYNRAWANFFNSPELRMTCQSGCGSGFSSEYKLPPVNSLIIKRYNVTFLSL